MAIAATSDQRGYWIITRNGHVYGFGNARSYGSLPVRSRSSVAAIAGTPDGKGYWILSTSGSVATFGDATYFGSARPVRASRPAVSITPTKDGKGYYVARAGGGVFPFGDATWKGGAIRLHQKSFVDLNVTPTGKGYWLVESTGLVVPFGDARTGVARALGIQVAGLVPLSNSQFTLVSRSGLFRTIGPGAVVHRSGSATRSTIAKPGRSTRAGSGVDTSGAGSVGTGGTAAGGFAGPSPTPTIAGGPLHLIYSDEFNGGSLSSTWSTCWWYSPNGCSNGDGEGEWYAPSNVSVANGALSLTAHDTPTAGKMMSTGASRSYRYTSGMVTSYQKFSFTYGYVEWRAQLPSGQGFWPALWMMPANNSWPPEIDALETVGNQPNIGNFTYHPPAGASQGFDKNIPGLSSGWHTFGVDWEPGSITWYVDGTKVASTTNDVTGDAMYLVMNLAVGGAWPGYPDATTAFPSSLNIDYVRVWQHT